MVGMEAWISLMLRLIRNRGGGRVVSAAAWNPKGSFSARKFDSFSNLSFVTKYELKA
jgi:hypothetical protein